MGGRPDCTKQFSSVTIHVGKNASNLKTLGDSTEDVTSGPNVMELSARLNQGQSHKPSQLSIFRQQEFMDRSPGHISNKINVRESLPQHFEQMSGMLQIHRASILSSFMYSPVVAPISNASSPFRLWA